MPRLTRSFSPRIPPARSARAAQPLRLKPTLKLLLLALLAAQSCTFAPAPSPDTGVPEGWTLRFEDHFDRDLSRWHVWQSGAFNEELQHYQPANLRLRNGELAIEARRESVTGATRPTDPRPKSFLFTSGRIESKATFGPDSATGAVRISARLRAAAGYGMWPAFWLCGDAWPTNGEIDIFELRGHEPFEYVTNYAYGPVAGQNQAPDATSRIQSATNLTDDWHVYELIWTRRELTFLLDGTIVDVKRGGHVPDLFGKPQRIVLNLAVGGTFFGHPPADRIQPGTFRADWVRVYTAP